METVATLSSKYQVVIPREIRKALHLEPGDQLIVESAGRKVIMRPKPRNYTTYMRGLHKEVWKGVEASEYIRKERNAWEK